MAGPKNKPVVQGAMCTCTNGMTPVTLGMPPNPPPSTTTVMIENKLVFCVMDFTIPQPGFGTCKANPTPSGPGPCVPAITGWVPNTSTVLIGGKPAVNNSCKMMCSLGGSISITNPGATKTMIP